MIPSWSLLFFCFIEGNEEMNPYGLVDRNIILNKSLSLEAKGIYGILMSLDGTDFELDEICEYVSESKAVVEKALNELVNHGFISFEK